MKKGIKIIAIVLSLAIVLILIMLFVFPRNEKKEVKKEDKTVDKKVEGMAAVYDIQLTVASPNDKHIHFVRYPYYYAVFTEGNDYIDFDLERKTMHYIPQEDLDFFLEFIDKYDDSSDRTDDSKFTYCFSVTCYKDGEDSEIDTRKIVYGYDTFPEELNDVIDRMNRLCNDKLLDYPTEVIEDVPSFIYQELGVGEDKYPREDIEKMFDEYGELALNEMFSDSNGFAGMMSGYYSSISEGNIEKYISSDLREATEISDTDFTEFVDKYLAELGDGWEVSSEVDTSGLTMIYKDGHPTNGYMYIGKAELVSEWDKKGDLEYDDYNGRYTYEMPAGGEGMTKISEFIYNEDASVVLVDYKCAGLQYDEYVELFYNLKTK